MTRKVQGIILDDCSIIAYGSGKKEYDLDQALKIASHNIGKHQFCLKKR